MQLNGTALPSMCKGRGALPCTLKTHTQELGSEHTQGLEAVGARRVHSYFCIRSGRGRPVYQLLSKSLTTRQS